MRGKNNLPHFLLFDEKGSSGASSHPRVRYFPSQLLLKIIGLFSSYPSRPTLPLPLPPPPTMQTGRQGGKQLDSLFWDKFSRNLKRKRRDSKIELDSIFCLTQKTFLLWHSQLIFLVFRLKFKQPVQTVLMLIRATLPLSSRSRNYASATIQLQSFKWNLYET